MSLRTGLIVALASSPFFFPFLAAPGGTPHSASDGESVEGVAQGRDVDDGTPGPSLPNPTLPFLDPTVTGSSLQTYGGHQYWVSTVGNCCEVALASGPDGAVWAAGSARVWRTTNGGQTWTAAPLAPLNVNAEGDVAVAPNGDVLTVWFDLVDPYGDKIWVSQDAGASWEFRPLTGPQPAPDRPWVLATALSPADAANPLQPNPYLAVHQAGVGNKYYWFSGNGGLTWERPGLAVGVPNAPLPALGSNAFLDFTKPFAQGMPTLFVALPGGELLDVSTKRWTEDGVHWFNAGSDLPSPGSQYLYWDAGSDGTLWAVRLEAGAGGTYVVKYRWFDGVWHDGNAVGTLAARPRYFAGLFPSETVAAAVKSHGDLLGVATREGNQDVLVRFAGAKGASPTVTKELIGTGSPGRYDFPNLVFDAQGRAVVSLRSSLAAYALTP